IDGGSTGHLFSSGRHLASGSTGGAVDLFGRDIVLVGALIDASGETGGGSARLGGEFQGRDPALGGAATLTLPPATPLPAPTSAPTIRADALRAGGGGRVAVRARQETAFAGAVSARGGPTGGPGGFVDLSGQGNLTYGGSTDAGATSGKNGTLLLDPKNITIS